jgi:DNA-cytosine methyltransferase
MMNNAEKPQLTIPRVMPRFSSVLSLFDGMSCGQIALNRVGIEYDNYFASEVDKHAIKVTQNNYPKTIQLGDVCGIQYEDGALFHHQNDNPLKNGGSFITKIDLLIGGSPCQGFSFAGKGLNFEDPRSKLFFEFVRLKNETKPRYFLLENVVMKKEHEKVISEFLGVEPILINSNLVSAQNRKRLYWTNIPGITQPVDKGITWGDVREHGIELGAMYYTDKAMEWIGKHGTRKGKPLKIHSDNEKMQMLEASHHKKYSSQRFFGIVDQPAQITGRRLNEHGKREDYNREIKTTQCLEVRGGDKINCLTTVQKDNVISQLPKGRYPNVFEQLEEGKHYRYITPIECERLQTVPDNYTDCVSNSQRYQMLGNGWTVDVIAHIFGSLLNGA